MALKLRLFAVGMKPHCASSSFCSNKMQQLWLKSWPAFILCCQTWKIPTEMVWKEEKKTQVGQKQKHLWCWGSVIKECHWQEVRQQGGDSLGCFLNTKLKHKNANAHVSSSSAATITPPALNSHSSLSSHVVAAWEEKYSQCRWRSRVLMQHKGLLREILQYARGQCD